ncbi:MAG: hypothetical protein WAQ27_02190, partial [Candidatus Microsaccharimonas sp.]
TGGLQTGGQAVVATNDSRLTNTRTPTDNTVTAAKLAANSVTYPKISAGTAISGQVLSYDGTNLTWTTNTPGGSVSDASTVTKGIIQLAGDLTGTAGTPTVSGVNGVAVSGTASAGRVLTATSSSAATWSTPGTVTLTADDITDATTVGKDVLTAADAAAARTAIGAGTSNLAIGTTSTTAKAGNYQPTADQVTETSTNKVLTATERTKLAGIATAATANATNAQLRDRTTHTGVQTASTISDLTETVQDIVGNTSTGLIKAGTNVTVAYDDTAGSLTISSTASGSGTKGDPGDMAPTNGTGSVTTWNGSSSYDLSTWTVPGTYHRTATNNISFSALPAPSASVSGTLTLVLRHTTSNSNAYTVTWPASVYLDPEQDNTFTSTAGYYTIYHLFWTGLKWSLSKQGDFNFSNL